MSRSGEVVVTVGDANDDPSGRPAVPLGRPPGAGTAPAGRTTEIDREQTDYHQLVEVESGHRPGDLERRRGIVAAYPSGACSHQAVELTAQGIVQSSESCNIAGIGAHGSHLKHICVDEMVGNF